MQKPISLIGNCRKVFFPTLLLFFLGVTSTLADGLPPFAEGVSCKSFPAPQSASLCAIQPDDGHPQWFFFTEGRTDKVEIDETNAILTGFSFSPSGRFMSVASRGEGHPILQVYATHLLVERNHVEFLQGWDPYPGWIDAVGWRKDELLIESNVPLHLDYDRNGDFSDDPIYHFRWTIDHPELELMPPYQNKKTGRE